MKLNWVLLFVAILAELIATSTLKASEGFSKLIPSLVCIIGYVIAFYCLSLTLRSIPVGVAYAIWAGVGIVLVTAVGCLYYKQPLDLAAVIGISLIILGVVIINIFSRISAH
ncbi:MAG: multidrug efflux SMR transporter [Burkholderiales bacterium]|nr:multidrug efflux SMR transporter [Burkholderiales bacterium]